jgi:hypothetical protein
MHKRCVSTSGNNIVAGRTDVAMISVCTTPTMTLPECKHGAAVCDAHQRDGLDALPRTQHGQDRREESKRRRRRPPHGAQAG